MDAIFVIKSNQLWQFSLPHIVQLINNKHIFWLIFVNTFTHIIVFDPSQKGYDARIEWHYNEQFPTILNHLDLNCISAVQYA